MAMRNCSVNKKGAKPKWLLDTSKSHKTSWQYWNKIWNAQPIWANRDKIKEVYSEAQKRRMRGETVVVDHIVPLKAETVYGLHVDYNLRIITELENAYKSNKIWPGQHSPQLELFPGPFAT